MLEQPESPTANQTKQKVFDHYLHRLQSEIHAIIQSETDYEDRIKSLEHELDACKQACFSAEDEKRILNEELVALREHLGFVMKNSGKRVVCVMDGDGTMFSTDLLARGRNGGQISAKLLSDSIAYHVPCPVQPVDVSVYLFFNKRGLIDDLLASTDDHRQDAVDNLDEFIVGFNEAGERFLMLDVGNGTDSVIAKVKAFVEDHAYAQETSKLLFGGCHDNRYSPLLQSLCDAGLRDKLVLLPGFSEMAAEIRGIHVPHLVIPELFMHVPLSASHQQLLLAGSRQTPTSVIGSSTNHHDATRPSSLGPPPGLTPHATANQSRPVPSVVSPPQNAGSTTPPPPYHGSSDEHSSTPCSDDSDSDEPPSMISSVSSLDALRVHKRSVSDGNPVPYTTAMNTKYEPFYPPRALAEPFTFINPHGLRSMRRSASRGRRINPNIPLSQHEPPPCTLYYLASNGCKHGADCRFGHDYELTEDDYDIVRAAAKKVPCPTANRGEICVFGEQCCYGHSCPFASKCNYMRHGKCKFAGPNMHRESTM